MASDHPQSRREFQQRLGPDRAIVYAQLVLLLALFFGAPLEYFVFGRGFTLWSGWINLLAFVVLAAVGLAVSLRAERDLGANLTMSPTPVEGGKLVDTGMYGVVRHPIYFSAFLLFLAWAVGWGSWFGLGMFVVSVVFFSVKARHEERLLLARFPDYADYRRRVRGAIVPRPW